MTLLLLPQMLQPQMNILISSSGSWGQQVAHALNEWLPGVLAPVKSRMIEEDIVASPLNWQRSFLSHLNAPIAVIVCIPDKCVASHELYFQLGQIMGKNAPNPLYPFFVGVDRAAIPRFLATQFQCVFAEKDSVLALVKDLNGRISQTPMPEAILLGNFSAKWPALSEALDRISSQNTKSVWERLWPFNGSSSQPTNSSEMQPPEQPQIPTIALSPEAMELLREAATDPGGTVMLLTTLQGRILQTNKRSFIEPGNPRSEAIWVAAVRELVRKDLFEPRGAKGEVFSVTAQGYRLADELRLARI